MIYNTGVDFMRSQDKKLNELIQNNIPLQLAAMETHRTMVKRIFEEEKDSSGAEIREPSPTPSIYVNPKNSPKKFTPMGKGEDKANRMKTAVQSKNKSGKVITKQVSIKSDYSERKTKYFEGGYAEFKKTIDRPKLVLFGQMRNDFRAGIRKLDKQSWISYFKNDINAKKADGIEARYQHAKIFSLTKKEIELFKTILVKETSKFMAA